MTQTVNERIFDYLPHAILEEFLSKSISITNNLYSDISNVYNKRSEIREKFKPKIRSDEEFNDIEIPTTCGIDGAYAIEKLLSYDIVGIATVAVEGITPPKEEKIWSDPKFWTLIKQVSHNDKIDVINQGLMLGNELVLATGAPHDVRFLDGSLITPIIKLNQAVDFILKEKIMNLGQVLFAEIPSIIESYLKILRADGPASYVGMPKYSRKSTYIEQINGRSQISERGLMTLILKPGEFLIPEESYNLPISWNLDVLINNNFLTENDFNEIRKYLDDLFICYYRPSNTTPAFRLDLPKNCCVNKNKFGKIIKAIKTQCFSSLFEPFPLYLADRMVKSLRWAIPPIKQAIIQQLALKFDDEIDQIYFNLHSYRTGEGF